MQGELGREEGGIGNHAFFNVVVSTQATKLYSLGRQFDAEREILELPVKRIWDSDLTRDGAVSAGQLRMQILGQPNPETEGKKCL